MVNQHADICYPIEWDLRPSSPSAIRLIHFGKLLDDKTSLEGMIRQTMKARAPYVVEETDHLCPLRCQI